MYGVAWYYLAKVYSITRTKTATFIMIYHINIRQKQL